MPAINWSGIMSTLGYFLTVNIRTAKEIGITNATILPIICPVVKVSPSIKIIPPKARNIQNIVNFDIFSLRNIYPNIARKIVCVWIIKFAFATVVLYMAKTYPAYPQDNIIPPKKPGRPTLYIEVNKFFL